MAERLRISHNTVKQRLFQRGVKPICRDALYDASALEQISDFGPKGFQLQNTAGSTSKAAKTGKPKK
jgi:hypothetical protein